MGNVRLGVPEKLVLALKAASGIDVFLETGTWKAGTTRWAAQHFRNVWSVEGYLPRFTKNRAAFDAYDGITPEHRERVVLHQGDSRTELAPALRFYGEPCIIWLDAHWCGEGAHDCNGDECPLMEELAQINESEHAAEHIILIDDARLFQAPPPYPHDPKQWPTLAQIKATIVPGRLWGIHEDVIAVIPKSAEYLDILHAWKASRLA